MIAVPVSPLETSRCKRLKAATHREHDSVDQLVMAAHPFEDRARYGRFLLVQHHFHGSLHGLYEDPHLNAWLPGLSSLSRLAAVEQDIRDLGQLPPALPARVKVDPAQALGWLYCSEGSNLGAAFLFKHTQRLGLDESLGARHLAAHPQGRAQHWKAFVSAIDGLALDEQQEADVIAGAIAAFEAYRTKVTEVFAADLHTTTDTSKG
ncbi:MULTISPECIES: biliverdin-producing heme oxygenase [Pseudomonas]|uniref:biliverdin-producing heme oxygenase n=1 Tax=Pseudomonas TaxID=286 RepID=UPI00119CE6D0|nr:MULTISPECIES: biliverdin-producing heme oxygenase [Pseudomonas]MBF8681173.1 biliverdin-producing heme oxygenase [Pseudomonas fulva]MBF8719908.1 biliverdin-producing heme oxygenase [Pseudomonas fulva]MBF8767912.1 biliverdin-producing heme oxygenase [Pseudomonas putida]MBF8784170.1 biliverdin-producing heme oxygenase [Pseudomonas fulva]MEB8057422.1 biliverdin-producing heme oxygenase [Pseudomonas fulva]